METQCLSSVAARLQVVHEERLLRFDSRQLCDLQEGLGRWLQFVYLVREEYLVEEVLGSVSAIVKALPSLLPVHGIGVAQEKQALALLLQL